MTEREHERKALNSKPKGFSSVASPNRRKKYRASAILSALDTATAYAADASGTRSSMRRTSSLTIRSGGLDRGELRGADSELEHDRAKVASAGLSSR
jgi:hypothetical protein